MRAFKCEDSTCDYQDDDRYQPNDEPAQPVGEYPHLPTVARAYKSVDELAAENRDLRAAREQLQRDNVALQAKLDDARAEYANIYPLLRDAGSLAAKLSRELSLIAPEIDRLEDENAELSIRADELFQARMEMQTELAVARAERDTARAQAAVQR